MPVSEARDLIRANVRPLPCEQVQMEHGRGRVLRQSILADQDQPPFDRSAMDGYALWELDSLDSKTVFQVMGTIAAGPVTSALPQLQPGQAVRLFTGAPVPVGATRVVPQEDVIFDPETKSICVREWPQARFIRRQGEDVLAGAELVAAGTMLSAVVLSVAASVGATELSVSRQPRVLHLTTGDELVSPSQTPGPGQIRDSNALLIRGLVEAAGATLVGQFRSGDHAEEIINPVRAFAEPYDLLLISGGASVGDFDYTAQALESLGFTLHFRQVDVRPGKPLIFATDGAQVAFGLPGNPVSHVVTFRLFVQTALAQLLHRAPSPDFRTGPLAASIAESNQKRETYHPARANSDGSFTPLSWQSSGHLANLVTADTLLRLPARRNSWLAGEIVEGWSVNSL